jgi:MFS family permease
MDQQLPKKRFLSLEAIAGLGLTICAVAILLLLGIALATFTYNSIATPPYRYLLAGAVLLFFTILIFALFKVVASERRRRRIWKETEERIKPSLSESQTAYLLKRVQFSVLEFTNSTRWLFRSVRAYKYAAVGLSVVSTIVLGLNFNHLEEQQRILYDGLTKNIALGLNTLIAALSTLSAFWNIDKYWIQNKVIKHQLKRLLSDIEFEMSNQEGDIKNPVILQDFFVRHQSILKDFHFYWEGVLTEKTDTKGK